MSAIDLNNCTSFTSGGTTFYYDRECRVIHTEQSCPSVFGVAVEPIIIGRKITQPSRNYTLINGRATFYDESVAKPVAPPLSASKDIVITAGSVPESLVVENLEGGVTATNCVLKTVNAAKKIGLTNVKVTTVRSSEDAVVMDGGEADSVSAKTSVTLTNAKVNSVVSMGKTLLLDASCTRLISEKDVVALDSKVDLLRTRGNITLNNSTVTDLTFVIDNNIEKTLQRERILKINAATSITGKVRVICDHTHLLAARRELGIEDPNAKIEVVLKIKEGSFTGEIGTENCTVKVVHES